MSSRGSLPNTHRTPSLPASLSGQSSSWYALRTGNRTRWKELNRINVLRSRTGEIGVFGIFFFLSPSIFQIEERKTVVILMDAEGAFDTNKSAEDDKNIFVLNLLLSSVQIFNVTGNLYSDELDALELFTGFGRLIGSQSSREDGRNELKPFQNLIILVRDWKFKDQYAYGWDGGRAKMMR